MGAQTIQRTGKRWKGAQGLGALGCAVGAVLAFVPQAAGVGFALLGGGAALFLFGRLGAWWAHG